MKKVVGALAILGASIMVLTSCNNSNNSNNEKGEIVFQGVKNAQDSSCGTYVELYRVSSNDLQKKVWIYQLIQYDNYFTITYKSGDTKNQTTYTVETYSNSIFGYYFVDWIYEDK